MPPVTPENVRKEIIRRWLYKLQSVREIEQTIGVPKSTASNVIAVFRSDEPDIENFHEMWKTIRDSNRNIVDALRIANFAAQINDLGVSMELVKQAIELVKRFGDKTDEAVSFAMDLSDRAKASGKSYDQTVLEEQKLRNNVESLQPRVETLQAEEKRLNGELPKLRELRELDRKLNENKIRPDELSGFIDDNKEYVKNGFNPEAARILSTELKKIGLTPTEASGTIRKILTEFTSLESGIVPLKKEYETLGGKVLKINKDISTAKEDLDQLRVFYKEENTRLSKEYESKRDSLEVQLSEPRQEKEGIQKVIGDLVLREKVLDAEIKQKEDRISIADTFYALVTAGSIPGLGLDSLIFWIGSAKAAKQQGFSGESELKAARQKVVDMLMKIANGEVYGKSDYYSLQKKLEQDREENEGQEEAYGEMFRKEKVYKEEISRLGDGIEVRDAVVENIAKFLPVYVKTDKGRKYGVTPTAYLNVRLQCAGCKAENMVRNDNLSGELTYTCKQCGESRPISLSNLYTKEVDYRLR